MPSWGTSQPVFRNTHWVSRDPHPGHPGPQSTPCTPSLWPRPHTAQQAHVPLLVLPPDPHAPQKTDPPSRLCNSPAAGASPRRKYNLPFSDSPSETPQLSGEAFPQGRASPGLFPPSSSGFVESCAACTHGSGTSSEAHSMSCFSFRGFSWAAAGLRTQHEQMLTQWSVVRDAPSGASRPAPGRLGVPSGGRCLASSLS